MVQASKIDLCSMFQDFRYVAPISIAQNPIAVIKIVMKFHVTERYEPIEPGVSHRFHRLHKPIPCNTPLKFFSLIRHLKRETLPADNGNIALNLKGQDVRV